MPRFSALIAVTAILIAGCTGVGSAASTAPSTATSNHPSLDLTIVGGSGAGSYVSDPSASLNYCSHTKDGSWRVMYSGGSPWVSVDLLVGPRAAEAGRATDVALEITAGPAYLWIDQPKFRGGDAPGRSKATVAVRSDGGGTTFDVAATTPNRTPAGDGVSSDVALTVVCPG